VNETAALEWIRNLSSKTHQNRMLLQGIGDDCAILRPRPDEDLVFTTDFVLEERHFERESHTAAEIGHKALARSLSDLAAMGSEPVFCTVSLAIPPQLAGRWLKDFYKGLMALAAEYKLMLAGGDLARFGKVVADVMCCGRVPRGTAMLRSAAKLGDGIYVTGQLGASAHGFVTRRGPAWARHKRPSPRITTGIALRRLGVRACMDLSDGLSLDLKRLCFASKVSAEIDSALPMARGASLDEALHGGEDYELLFTVPKSSAIPQDADGLPLTRIGTIARGPAGRVRLDGRELRPQGFDHFA
jgi:thiamine-monophosphate kinase